MRVHLSGNPDSGVFAAKLLLIGNGTVPADENGDIDLSFLNANIVDSEEALISKIYPSLNEHSFDLEWFGERAILAPKNADVATLNDKLLQQQNGELKTYRSFDTTVEVNDAINYPTEVLNSLEPPGMPLHQLKLKVGTPIMLLRSLDAPRLVNGTRLIVKKLFDNVILATIITGKFAGEDVFIPRIALLPSNFPIEFKRTQFPVKLCYAISINKSQGQSLKFAGIHLAAGPCFSHGQLYVACSRCGDNRNLTLLAPGGKTRNIVYHQIFE